MRVVMQENAALKSTTGWGMRTIEMLGWEAAMPAHA